MFDIGFSELVLVAVIALIVLGPERLPTAARSVGRWVGKARRVMNQINQEIEKQIKLEELQEKLRKEGDTLGAAHIQQTVDTALQEAKKFEHLVNQDVMAKTSETTPTEPPKPAQPAPNQPTLTNTEQPEQR